MIFEINRVSLLVLGRQLAAYRDTRDRSSWLVLSLVLMEAVMISDRGSNTYWRVHHVDVK